MLSKEQIIAAGVTDEAVAVKLATLSKNDEDVVVGAATKAVKDGIDADIEKITGTTKPADTKTHVFLTSELTRLKTEAEKGGDSKELKAQVEKLTAEKTELEKQVKAGATDPALKTQIEKLEKDIRLKDDEINNLKTTGEKTLKEKEDELERVKAETHELRVLGDFDAWERDAAVKFKGTIPEGILKETIENRRKSLLSEIKTDVIDGKTVVVDDKGNPLRNPNDNNNPFTPGTFYGTKIADLLDTGKVQGGAGTKGGGGTGTASVDVSGAKSQLEANKVIERHILENEGIPKTSEKFAVRQTEIAKEAGIGDLPIR